MPAPVQPDLFRRWGHSFEEDHDGVRVYRPDGFAFPRARGRAGIEFQPGGGFIEWAVGRGDARQPRPGSWRHDGDGALVVTSQDGDQRSMTIVHLDADRLELGPGAGS